MKSAKLQLRSKQRKVNDLIESIKSRLSDYNGEQINWGHVGTLENVVNQLNEIDNMLARYEAEPTIDAKVFDCKTRRFVIDQD